MPVKFSEKNSVEAERKPSMWCGLLRGLVAWCWSRDGTGQPRVAKLAGPELGNLDMTNIQSSAPHAVAVWTHHKSR